MKTRAAKKSDAVEAGDVRWTVLNAATGEEVVVSARDAAGACSWALRKCSRVARASNDGELLEATAFAARPEYDERTVAVHQLIRNYFANVEAIERFRGKLGETGTGYGYAYELEWSESVFKLAAEAKVLQHVITAVWNAEAKGAPLSLEALREHAKEQALRGATYPSKSTSTTANLMHLEETAAWANLVERGRL